MTISCKRRGTVLSVVLAVMLCVTLFLSALLRMPGGIFKIAGRLAEKQQAIYDGESRILMFVSGLPTDGVDVSALGPWLELSTKVGEWGCLRVLAGMKNDSLSRQQKRHLVERVRTMLERKILLGTNLQIKQGNRRLLGSASSVPQSLIVQDGDLLVDLFGNAGSCNYKSSGSIRVKGNAAFDTLRLFASGPVQITGSSRIGWLEVFSADQVEIAGETLFSGIVTSNNQVRLEQHSLAQFPSSLLSVNASVEYGPKNLAAPLLLPPIEKSSTLVPIRWSLL